MAEILDGLKTSEIIKQEIKQEIEQVLKTGKRPPHLAAILVGENGASKAYVNAKVKDCKEVGIQSKVLVFPDTISENELLEEIKILNNDQDVDGFIVQLPLPKGINQEKIINAIVPNKDVDGFHPENFGKMALEMDSFLPATPFGIITLLERYEIPTQGKNCVVIGRSRIVGRPMSILMSRKGNPGDSTVTLLHSHSQDIEKFTREADIVIVALGSPNYLKGSMIKQGAVVIDVGITRVEDGGEKGYHLAGDIDYESCFPKASWITPVPGGVGPMTRAMLLKNTLLAYKKKENLLKYLD